MIFYFELLQTSEKLAVYLTTLSFCAPKLASGTSILLSASSRVRFYSLFCYTFHEHEKVCGPKYVNIRRRDRPIKFYSERIRMTSNVIWFSNDHLSAHTHVYLSVCLCASPLSLHENINRIRSELWANNCWKLSLR